MGEVGSAEIELTSSMLVPPLVPTLNPPPEKSKLFLVCHTVSLPLLPIVSYSLVSIYSIPRMHTAQESAYPFDP